MRYERETRAGNRAQVRRMRERQRKNGRIIIACGIAAWFFIVLNLFLLTRMQARMKDMRDFLNTTYSRLTLVQQELERRGSGAGNGVWQAPAIPQQAGDAVTAGTGSVLAGSYASLWGMEEVDVPKVRSREEVLRRLKSLGAENDTMKEIYENRAAYPEKLLEALANNPEMAGFVSGYTGTEDRARGGGDGGRKGGGIPAVPAVGSQVGLREVRQGQLHSPFGLRSHLSGHGDVLPDG